MYTLLILTEFEIKMDELLKHEYKAHVLLAVRVLTSSHIIYLLENSTACLHKISQHYYENSFDHMDPSRGFQGLLGTPDHTLRISFVSQYIIASKKCIIPP